MALVSLALNNLLMKGVSCESPETLHTFSKASGKTFFVISILELPVAFGGLKVGSWLINWYVPQSVIVGSKIHTDLYFN